MVGRTIATAQMGMRHQHCPPHIRATLEGIPIASSTEQPTSNQTTLAGTFGQSPLASRMPLTPAFLFVISLGLRAAQLLNQRHPDAQPQKLQAEYITRLCLEQRLSSLIQYAILTRYSPTAWMVRQFDTLFP